jgi:photosystem II stability/assembly factor-like uncharacterized protein
MKTRIGLTRVESFRDLPGWFEWDFRELRFGEMSFSSPTCGWLLLDHLLFQSIDGGKSWRYVDLPIPAGMLPQFVFANAADSCWLVLSQIGDTRPCRIPVVRVSNHGGRIEPVWVGETNGWYTIGSRVFFTTPEVGWLIATESVNGQEFGVMFSTDNAGQTWRPVARQSLITKRMWFVDSRNGWELARTNAQAAKRAHRVFLEGQPDEQILIGGHDYAVLGTTDRGRSWTERVRVKRDLFALTVLGNTVHVAGQGGLLMRSPDRGATWNKQLSRTRCDIYAMSFLVDGRGLAVGDEGLILLTDNNGIEWVRLSHAGRNSFHGVHWINDSAGVLVDPKGVHIFALL